MLTAFAQVEDSLAALRILADESAQQDQAVAAAEQGLKLARNRYDAGVTSYLEVVTAQNAALANERTSVDLLTRRMVASVNLVKALGGGWMTSSDAAPSGVRAATEVPSPRL